MTAAPGPGDEGSSPPERITLVVNPSSGAGRARSLVPAFLGRLAEHGIRTSVEVSGSADDLRARVRRLRDEGASLVAVAGGDGTAHLAIQELADSAAALALLPTGTGDDNARTLGLPLGDPRAAADAVAFGVDRGVDLAHVTAADGTERYFLGVLSAGFDSFVNERANAMSWPKGKAKYAAAIVGELRVFKPVRYEADIDGVAVSEGAMLVAVGNGRSYGGGMLICPDADVHDGVLDVTWLEAVGIPTFLRAFPSVFRGTHVRRGDVRTFRGSSIRLVADGQLAYADGERVGPLPIDIRVVPSALRVRVPA